MKKLCHCCRLNSKEAHAPIRNLFQFYSYSTITIFYLAKFASKSGTSCIADATDNELLIGWSNADIAVFVRDKKATLSLCCGNKMTDLTTGWRKHCFTLKAGGSIKVLQHPQLQLSVILSNM